MTSEMPSTCIGLIIFNHQILFVLMSPCLDGAARAGTGSIMDSRSTSALTGSQKMAVKSRMQLAGAVE